MKNSICFRLTGNFALFTDPITKTGGEKCSYHIPTYEAIKGILKSIYWKPTIIWYVDRVRVMKPLRTQTKGIKLRKWHESGSDLSIYTYLRDVEYKIEAHFEWNLFREELSKDRIDGKHYAIAKRVLEKGGRQDIFLGVRECQGYVEPCEFNTGIGAYDSIDELAFGVMFHSFGYPDETGRNELSARLWRPVMKRGIISFPRPENVEMVRSIRPMKAKKFALDEDILKVTKEETNL